MDRRPGLAVLALGVLLRPAPVAAQAWNSDAALALARRAVLRRGGAVADSSLHDYKAQAHGFLFFLGAFGQGLADPPRLVKADQLELEVYWKAPASSKQRVIGWRDQTQLPTDINYHRDHLGIIQNNFGAALRLGEGDEVRDVPHPLSPAGPDIYDFALGDTTTIMLPEREVRVVTLRVRPKDFGLPRIVGTLYLDAETADLVRMAFNFTPRSYLDAELEDVSIVLDNALWERRYWLPYRQEIEIRRRATWLDVPVRGIIRARWEIDGYVLNLGLANSWFAGDEITFLPKAERDSFPWKEPLGAALQDIAEPVRQNDLERVRAEVEQIGGRRAHHLPPRPWRAERVAGHRGTGVDRLTRGDRGASERQLPPEPLPGRPWGRLGAACARAQERGLRGAARSARRDDARGWPEGRRRHLSAALRRGSRPVPCGHNAAAAAGARRRGERRAPDPPCVRARWARDSAGRRIPPMGRAAHGLVASRVARSRPVRVARRRAVRAHASDPHRRALRGARLGRRCGDGHALGGDARHAHHARPRVRVAGCVPLGGGIRHRHAPAGARLRRDAGFLGNPLKEVGGGCGGWWRVGKVDCVLTNLL